VKFLVPKIPIGEKKNCAAKQGKKERARGIKSELYLKKKHYLVTTIKTTVCFTGTNPQCQNIGLDHVRYKNAKKRRNIYANLCVIV